MGRGIFGTLWVLVAAILFAAASAGAAGPAGPAGASWNLQQLIDRVRAVNAKAPDPALPLPFTAQLVLPGEVLLDPVVVTDAELTSAGASTTWDEVDEPQQYVVGPLFSPTCPNAQYPTINAAVIAAPPGAVIKVCPGLYPESVLAFKDGQTIRALARADDGAHRCAPGNPATDPTQYAIVEPAGFPGFSISADRVVIDGFVVQGGSSGVETTGTASGYDIRRNILQSNGMGLMLGSKGTLSSRARHNCTRNNTLGVVASATSNVGVENNFVQANVLLGVYLQSDTGGVRVSHNTLTQNYDGIFAVSEQNTFIGDNRVVSPTTNPTSGGILATLSSGLTIERNALDGPGYTGILVDSSTAANTVVRKNRVQGFGTDPLNPGAGILLSSNNGILVQGNRTDLNGYGVQLGDGSMWNQVRGNRSLSNSGSGIRAEMNTSLNSIEGNKALGNNPDCYDESVGGGTAGTANFWRGNIGRSENRPGLCKRRTSDD